MAWAAPLLGALVLGPVGPSGLGPSSASAGQWKAASPSAGARATVSTGSSTATAASTGAASEADASDNRAASGALRWRSPSRRASSHRASAHAQAAGRAPRLLSDQSHSRPIAARTAARIASRASSSSAIILTRGTSDEHDPFEDPFQDKSPGAAGPRPSQLKLFVGSQEPETLPEFDMQQQEEEDLAAPYDQLEPVPPLDDLAQAPLIDDQPCPKPSDLKPIREITNRITAEPGEFPQECLLGDERFVPRSWAMTTYTWKASGLCHKPLYFEQVGVERYAHSWGPVLQPVISGAHFFASVPLLPYKMGLEPPCECIYPLGYYRPGSCAPYTIGPVPISLRAAALQAGATTGVVTAFP